MRETREKVVRDVSVQAAMCKNVVQPLADAEHAIEDTVGMIEILKYLNKLLVELPFVVVMEDYRRKKLPNTSRIGI